MSFRTDSFLTFLVAIFKNICSYFFSAICLANLSFVDRLTRLKTSLVMVNNLLKLLSHPVYFLVQKSVVSFILLLFFVELRVESGSVHSACRKCFWNVKGPLIHENLYFLLLRDLVCKNLNFYIKIHRFYEIKIQQIWKSIHQMNLTLKRSIKIVFPFLVSLIVKSLGIEILNNGTGIATFHDPWFVSMKLDCTIFMPSLDYRMSANSFRRNYFFLKVENVEIFI